MDTPKNIKNDNTNPEKDETRPENDHANVGVEKFLRSKLFNHSDRNVVAPVTINQELSKIYNGNYPKATVAADYNSGVPVDFLLAAHLDNDFEAKLPAKIQILLKERNLFGRNKVDIHWVVQLRAFIGGNSDSTTNNITFLKAHTWADPDVPNQFNGNRLYADFEYGVFEADFDVSHEVKLDQMRPFNVHTHDGMLSPRTAAIKLPDDINVSVSFYSLVIGKPYQTNEKRAVVTLHWILGGDNRMPTKNEDVYHFGRVLFEPSPRNPENFLWRTARSQFANVKEFLEELRKCPLKDSSLMKSLDRLLK